MCIEREREREKYNYCICIFNTCTYAKENEWSSLLYWYKNTNSKAVQILTHCIVSPLHVKRSVCDGELVGLTVPQFKLLSG